MGCTKEDLIALQEMLDNKNIDILQLWSEGIKEFEESLKDVEVSLFKFNESADKTKIVITQKHHPNPNTRTYNKKKFR